MITTLTIQNYNQYHQNKLYLNNQNINIITNIPIFKKQSKINLNNKIFKIKQLNTHTLNLIIIQNNIILIIKNNNQLQKIKKFYTHKQKKSTISINFNIFKKTKLTTSQIQKLSKKYNTSINSKSKILII